MDTSWTVQLRLNQPKISGRQTTVWGTMGRLLGEEYFLRSAFQIHIPPLFQVNFLFTLLSKLPKSLEISPLLRIWKWGGVWIFYRLTSNPKEFYRSVEMIMHFKHWQDLRSRPTSLQYLYFSNCISHYYQACCEWYQKPMRWHKNNIISLLYSTGNVLRCAAPVAGHFIEGQSSVAISLSNTHIQNTQRHTQTENECGYIVFDDHHKG